MTAFKVRSPQPAGAGGERVARRSLVAGVAVEVLRLSSPFAKGAQDKSDSLRDDSVLRSGGAGKVAVAIRRRGGKQQVPRWARDDKLRRKAKASGPKVGH